MGLDPMQFSEVSFSGAQGLPIDSYGPGFFRVRGKVIEGAVLVIPSGAKLWMGYGDTQPLLDARTQIDVAFIGTGRGAERVPASFRDPLVNAGLAIEPMPTPSACRTYNVLLGEGRRVGAALLPV